MDQKSNALNWFEIPAENLDRAKKFYEKVFNVTLNPAPDMMGMKMATFPSEMENGKVSGGIVQSTMHKPSKMGRDRKSTRLNSSHVEISYAVFCLKKKKKSKIHNLYLNT